MTYHTQLWGACGDSRLQLIGDEALHGVEPAARHHYGLPQPIGFGRPCLTGSRCIKVEEK